VVHNPAINLLWFAAGCMLLGVLAVFHFPLRRVWVRAEAEGEGVRMRLASVSNRDVLFAREFEGLALAVDREVRSLAQATASRSGAGVAGPAGVAGVAPVETPGGGGPVAGEGVLSPTALVGRDQRVGP
jgi:hypothetical protein